jgi:translation machinery-associated protein 16
VDLTHGANAALFRRWDGAEAAYVQMLRFVRISSASPDVVVVSRPGKHRDLEGAMDEDAEVPALIPAST